MSVYGLGLLNYIKHNEEKEKSRKRKNKNTGSEEAGDGP